MLEFVVEGGKIKKVLPCKEDPISEGKPCIKGLTCHEPLSIRRIRKPMVRKGKKLVPTSWKEAYRRIEEEFSRLRPKEIAFYGSGLATNEANYLLQKFARRVIKTGNIDSSARLCHASTIKAFQMAFGLGAMSAYIDDIKDADCILIIGSDPKSDYPVAFNKVLEAKRRGAKLIVVEDSFSFSSKHADLHLKIRSGRFLPLLNFLAKYIIENGLYDENAPYLDGFYELQSLVSKYEPGKVAKECNVNEKLLGKAASIVGRSERLVIMYGMAMTQHVSGTKNVLGVTNLALLKGGKVVCMRGKVNIQGCGDVGCYPRGDGILELLFGDVIKAIYIMDSNIAQSFPELDKVHEKLREMFVVYAGPFENSMLKFADVVLPATTLLESSGTITNAERRVRAFERVIKPICGKTHWEILKDLFEVFGHPLKHEDVWDTTREMLEKVEPFKRIKFEDLFGMEGTFAEKGHKWEKFIPVEFTAVEEEKTKKYPFVLTTKRLPWHFVTGDMTLRSKTLKKFAGEPYCYMSPRDMRKLKLKDGDLVEVESEVGKMRIKVKGKTEVDDGVVVIPFHFPKALVNKLIPFQLDPLSREPNLKVVDVKIKKLPS